MRLNVESEIPGDRIGNHIHGSDEVYEGGQRIKVAKRKRVRPLITLFVPRAVLQARD